MGACGRIHSDHTRRGRDLPFPIRTEGPPAKSQISWGVCATHLARLVTTDAGASAESHAAAQNVLDLLADLE